MQTNGEIDAQESELVSAAVGGDLDAFNDLVSKYQDLVYNLAYSILVDYYEAEDAAQETFISAFQHLAGFRGGSFRGWLLRIVTNTCYDSLRAHKRRQTVPLYPEDRAGDETESAAWLADPHPSVQAEVERGEFSQTLYRWLDELPMPFRTSLR